MVMAAEAAVVTASARVGGGQGHEDKGTIIVAAMYYSKLLLHCLCEIYFA